MNIQIANSVATAIKVSVKLYGQHNAEQVINEHINNIFGGTDGDYFIVNSMKRQTPNGKEYKLVLVEDRDQVKHQVFFELVPVPSSNTI